MEATYSIYYTMIVENEAIPEQVLHQVKDHYIKNGFLYVYCVSSSRLIENALNINNLLLYRAKNEDNGNK